MDKGKAIRELAAQGAVFIGGAEIIDTTPKSTGPQFGCYSRDLHDPVQKRLRQSDVEVLQRLASIRHDNASNVLAIHAANELLRRRLNFICTIKLDLHPRLKLPRQKAYLLRLLSPLPSLVQLMEFRSGTTS